jgi:hypothetical protein
MNAVDWSQAFSRIFRRSRAREARAWRRHFESLRFQGHGGGQIATHRALIHLPVRRSQLWVSAIVAIAMSIAWFALQPYIAQMWQLILEMGEEALGFGSAVAHSDTHLGVYVFRIPYPDVPDYLPSSAVWWVTLIVMLVLFFLSFLISFRYLPFTYLLRSALFLQLSAMVFFALWPAAFPYTLTDYLYGMLLAGYVLIGLIPLVFGLIYYVFDFGIVKKIALTLLVMGHLAVFIPLQYLLQGYVIHQLSLLFLPLSFFLLGLPIDVLLLIAFYSWGMSWEPRGAASTPAAPPV